MVARYCKIDKYRKVWRQFCERSHNHTGSPGCLGGCLAHHTSLSRGSHREDRGKKACRLVGKGGPHGGEGGPQPRLLQSPAPV